MRFAELHLIRYGRFEGCDLSFPKQNSSDLQLIYGPNEAGKSTTLAAVSDLLFGFPHTTTFDFRFDKQLLRIGAVIEADGRKVTVRRRKGNSGTLLSEDDRPLDEGILAALLSGQTADTFRRMFSLDHKRLRDGGQAILDAKDDVGQAIFAAGAGLVGIAQLLESLEEKAKAIWTPRAAAGRTYYDAQQKFDDARAILKLALLKPAKWDDLRKQIGELQQQLEELRAQRLETETKRRRLERRRRIMAPIAKRTLLLHSLQELSSIPDFPADANERFQEIEKSIERAETEKRIAQDRAAAASKGLSSVTVNDDLLGHASEIEELREQKGATEASLRDLPKRKADITSLSDAIGRSQNELGWQAETTKALREKIPSRVRIAEIRDLLEQIGAGEAVVEQAAQEVEERKREAEELGREVSSLRPAMDTTSLSAAVRFALTKGDVDEGLRDANSVRQHAEADLNCALERLLPWQGGLAALETLVPPTTTAVADASRRRLEREADLRREQATLEEDQYNLKQLNLERVQTVRDDRAVSPEVLAAARQDRDKNWGTLREHIMGRQMLKAPEASVKTFDGQLKRTDELGDHRFSMAEQSGRLVALTEEIERLTLSIEAGESKVASAQSALNDLDAEWHTLVAPLTFKPSPTDCTSWLGRRDEALRAGQKFATANSAIAKATEQHVTARKALTDAFRSSGLNIDLEAETGVLVSTAESRVDSEVAARHVRDTLEQKIETTHLNLGRAETKLSNAQTALRQLIDKWQPALKNAGFEDASAAIVRTRLEVLDDLRGQVDEVLGLEQRVDAMEADVEAFSSRVQTVAVACKCGDPSRTAIEILADLTAALATASQDNRRRETHQSQLDDANEKIAAAIRAIGTAEERLEPLMGVAGVAKREALRALLAQAQQRSVRMTEMSAVEVDVVSLGDGLELAALLEEVKDAEPDLVKAEIDSAEAQLAELNEKIETTTANLTTAKAEFDSLNDGPDAVIAAADMALAKSEMEVQAEAYVRVRAETALLRWAIERYRRDKQAPLLARASKLFSLLTLDRYSALVVDTDSNRPQLCGLPSGGARLVPVEGMSDGTVDQLYLSLRLAAVEDAVDSGMHLPFLADDLFINYDDDRATAGFTALAELSKKTQVLFFTHHQHLVSLAERTLTSLQAPVCHLNA